jgi:hypothetical protein
MNSRTLIITMLVAAAGIVVCDGTALATSVTGARIVNIRADANGLAIIAIDQTVAGPPCSANGSIFAFNTNTAGGRSILTIAMAAKLSGRLVEFAGNNGCAGGAGFEDLIYLNMQ